MTLKQSASIDVGYPILDAKFINNKTVLVAGGGGEGNNGIPNKITAIKCSFKVNDAKRRLQKFREVQLPANEDSPQCIDVTRLIDENEYNVVVGCNQSSELIKSMNINNNVRKYKFNKEEHLIFDDAAQFEEEISGDTDEYPKVIKISQNNNVGCLMTSALPSVLYFFNPDALELKFKYKPPGNDEIKDFAFSPKTGSKLCYITSSSVVSISAESNSVIGTSTTASVDKQLQKYNLSKVKFINDNEVVISSSVKGGKGAALLRYDLTKQKIVQERVIAKKLNNIVALDVSVPQDLVAFAGNDLIVYIVKLSNFKLLETIKKLHPFAITSVSFSPNGTKLATGSAANILNVVRVPPKYASGKSVIGTLLQYLFTIILIAALGVGIQKAHENGQLDGVIELLNQFLKDYREVGLHYGKIGKDLAGDYGKAGLELMEKYGKIAYTIAEEYGNKYGSKAIDIYKEKFSKADIVRDVGEQAKNTLNDIVLEVTRDLHEETIKTDFDSETLDDIKFTTQIVESSIEITADQSYQSESASEVSTASTEPVTAIPEYESIHEVVNNNTVVDENNLNKEYEQQSSVNKEDGIQKPDTNDSATDVNEGDYVDIIEEVTYEELGAREEVVASNSEAQQEEMANIVDDSVADDVDNVEIVEEIVEEVEPSLEEHIVEATDSQVAGFEEVEVVEEVVEEMEHAVEATGASVHEMEAKSEAASTSSKDIDYTEIVEELYEDAVEEPVAVDMEKAEALNISNSIYQDAEKEEGFTGDETIDQKDSLDSSKYEDIAKLPNEVSDIEKVQDAVEESKPVAGEENVKGEANHVTQEVPQAVQESKPVSDEPRESISIKGPEPVTTESDKSNPSHKDEASFNIGNESPIVNEAAGHVHSSSVVVEHPIASEISQEVTSSAVESLSVESVGPEQDIETGAAQSKQAQEVTSSEMSDSPPIQHYNDDDHANPAVDQSEQAEFAAQSSFNQAPEEETFVAQSVQQEAIAGVAEEQKYTPEEPVSLEEPHTVEISGTGGVDPTPQSNEAESIEEPPVSVSTPSSENVVVDQQISSLSPADEEASTLEPTGTTGKAVEESLLSSSSSAPSAPPSAPPSSQSAKKVTKVVTRTVKRSRITTPTENAREKDEL